MWSDCAYVFRWIIYALDGTSWQVHALQVMLFAEIGRHFVHVFQLRHSARTYTHQCKALQAAPHLTDRVHINHLNPAHTNSCGSLFLNVALSVMHALYKAERVA